MAAPFGQRAKDAELRLARDSDGMVSCWGFSASMKTTFFAPWTSRVMKDV